MMLSICAAAGAGEQIDTLKTELQSPDAEVRSDACLSLAAEGAAAIGLLAPRLQDRSMLVRHCAAYALSRIGGPTVENIFRQGLVSSSDHVRRISAIGLGMMGKADLRGCSPAPGRELGGSLGGHFRPGAIGGSPGAEPPQGGGR